MAEISLRGRLMHVERLLLELAGEETTPTPVRIPLRDAVDAVRRARARERLAREQRSDVHAGGGA